jgi:hypothetical protein
MIKRSCKDGFKRDSGAIAAKPRADSARSVIPWDDRRHSPDVTKVRKYIVFSMLLETLKVFL